MRCSVSKGVWQKGQKCDLWGWKHILWISAKELGFVGKNLNQSALLSSVCGSWRISGLGMDLCMTNISQMVEGLWVFFFLITFQQPIRSVFSPQECMGQLQIWEIWELGRRRHIGTAEGASQPNCIRLYLHGAHKWCSPACRLIRF